MRMTLQASGIPGRYTSTEVHPQPSNDKSLDFIVILQFFFILKVNSFKKRINYLNGFNTCKQDKKGTQWSGAKSFRVEIKMVLARLLVWLDSGIIARD